jgi:hypothetical protein
MPRMIVAVGNLPVTPDAAFRILSLETKCMLISNFRHYKTAQEFIEYNTLACTVETGVPSIPNIGDMRYNSFPDMLQVKIPRFCNHQGGNR